MEEGNARGWGKGDLCDTLNNKDLKKDLVIKQHTIKVKRKKEKHLFCSLSFCIFFP